MQWWMRHDQRAAAVVVLDQVELPQRVRGSSGVVASSPHSACSACIARSGPARLRATRRHVALDVEVVVLDPAGAHRVLHHLLAEAVVLEQLVGSRARAAPRGVTGVSSQTPTIIIRLTSLSMRSHAVSTRDMRSGAAAIGGLLGVRLSAATMLGNIASVNAIFTHRRRSHGRPESRLREGRCRLKSLPEKPDNMTLLKIYALYKQATEGDVDGKRPGFTDMVGRAKYDAWAAN
jgi:hypothetical protein